MCLCEVEFERCLYLRVAGWSLNEMSWIDCVWMVEFERCVYLRMAGWSLNGLGFAYGWWSLNESWMCVWLVEFERGVDLRKAGGVRSKLMAAHGRHAIVLMLRHCGEAQRACEGPRRILLHG
jgi:hypothetical protein